MYRHTLVPDAGVDGRRLDGRQQQLSSERAMPSRLTGAPTDCDRTFTLPSQHSPPPTFAEVCTLDTYLEGKGSPYTITERRVPDLIPVLGSQPAGDVNHKPDGRLPLLFIKASKTSFLSGI